MAPEPATQRPTPKDAKARRYVRVPDGRVGRLMWVAVGGINVKVQVGGRHEVFRQDAVELLPGVPALREVS